MDIGLKKIIHRDVAGILLIIIISSVYFFLQDFKRVEVRGNSLAPYIMSGTKVWINYAYEYNNKKIGRDSLITFYFKAQNKELIKFAKVIPGDTFKIDSENKTLLINGKFMVNKENKIYKLTDQNIKMLELYEKDLEGKLGDNMYLVFGNYPGNIDSGKFGPIFREDILGKVLFK